MADIFISYSRLDHDRLQPIVERLDSLGYSVWWDRRKRAGQARVEEIERELGAARAVMTVWSRQARNSTWVHAESSSALDQNKLLQLKLDNMTPPTPFDALPIADMSGARSEWGPIEDALARLVRGEAASPALPDAANVGLLATVSAAGAPKLLGAACACTLAAYAGAASAAHRGVMAPEQLQIALMAMLAVGAVCALVAGQRLLAVARAGG